MASSGLGAESDSLGVRSGGAELCAENKRLLEEDSATLTHLTGLTLVGSLSQPGSLSRALLLNVLWGRGEGLNIPQDPEGRIYLFIHTTSVY